MKSDLLIAILGGLLLISFLSFVFIKNRKDRKDLERKLNQDYKKKPDDENESVTDTDSRT